MTVNNGLQAHNKTIYDLELLTTEIEKLYKALKNLSIINEEHRIINGDLRYEIQQLEQTIIFYEKIINDWKNIVGMSEEDWTAIKKGVSKSIQIKEYE